MVSTLHFSGIRNAEALLFLATINGAPNPLRTKVVTYVGLSKARFNSRGGSGDVRLVSGSLDFLYQLGASASIGTKTLLLVENPWRAGRLPKRKQSPIKWIRKEQLKFGGATDFVYLFGVLGLDLDPTLSTLARSIGRMFDHSLPPSTTVAILPPELYTLNSQLRINGLTTPVAFKTHFARDGWGLRTFNPDELGIAFGLSQRLRVGIVNAFGFPLPPVQGFDRLAGGFDSQHSHCFDTSGSKAPNHSRATDQYLVSRSFPCLEPRLD
jgi:hypothetical protein